MARDCRPCCRVSPCVATQPRRPSPSPMPGKLCRSRRDVSPRRLNITTAPMSQAPRRRPWCRSSPLEDFFETSWNAARWPARRPPPTRRNKRAWDRASISEDGTSSPKTTTDRAGRSDHDRVFLWRGAEAWSSAQISQTPTRAVEKSKPTSPTCHSSVSANSDAYARRRNWVMPWANPACQDFSVSAGLSCRGRNRAFVRHLYDLHQTDAATNRGNSVAPLF